MKRKTGAQMAGESIVPLLKGKSCQRNNPLYFQFMDNRAIRISEWTMVEVDEAGWELFRAGCDPLENVNLASQYPEIVDKLQDDWLKWLQRDSGEAVYIPKSTKSGRHCGPQGDRGSAALYQPTAMPEKLKNRYPKP